MPTQQHGTYQPNQVASHLSKLYQQSTLYKQRTSTPKPLEVSRKTQAANTPRDGTRVPQPDQIAVHPPKQPQPSPEKSSNTPASTSLNKINISPPKSVDDIQKIKSVDNKKIPPSIDIEPRVHSNTSHVNTASVPVIPLEKPKQVNSAKLEPSPSDQADGETDQEVGETQQHEVSESETETRQSQIHTLTHSQFIQRVPVQKITAKEH